MTRREEGEKRAYRAVMLNVRANNPGPRDFALVLLLGVWLFTGDLVVPLMPFAALEAPEVRGVPFLSSMMCRGSAPG